MHLSVYTKGPGLEQVYFSLSHPHSLVMLSCKHACNVVHSNYKVHVNKKIKRQASWIARQTGKKIPFSRNQHLFLKSIDRVMLYKSLVLYMEWLCNGSAFLERGRCFAQKCTKFKDGTKSSK